MASPSHRLTVWQRLQLRFPLNKHFTIQDCVVHSSLNGSAVKQVICGVFQDGPEPSTILEQIHHMSGIPLVVRDSDMRFGGGIFAYGQDTNTWIYVVPAVQLWRLPWYLQRHGWVYVRIACAIADTRFEALQQLPFVPTPKHINLQ